MAFTAEQIRRSSVNRPGLLVVPDPAEGALDVVKVNLLATTDPGVGNDSTQGFVPGSMWVNVTDDRVFFCADASVGAAVWAQVGGGAGGLVDNSASETESTVTGTTAWQTKLVLSPSGGPFTGTYQLRWYMEFGHTPADGDTEVRAGRGDGGLVIYGSAEKEAKDDDEYLPFAGRSPILTLSAESPVFGLQFMTVQSTETALVRRARLEFWKV